MPTGTFSVARETETCKCGQYSLHAELYETNVKCKKRFLFILSFFAGQMFKTSFTGALFPNILASLLLPQFHCYNVGAKTNIAKCPMLLQIWASRGCGPIEMRAAGWPSRVQQWTLAAGRAAPPHSQLHRPGERQSLQCTFT